MPELSLLSQISLYVLLALIGILAMLLWRWQLKVFQGKAMPNPDGSADDWHQQKILYGIALADIVLACPASLAGIILVFLAPRWGFYLVAMVSFWFLWINLATTITSLRFENPKITLQWLFVFPLGSVVGLAYLVWSMLHFEAIFFL